MNERGAYLTRILPDGRVVDVYPLTFGRARLTVSQSLAVGWIDDGWCYDTPQRAVDAAWAWNGQGEPEGWMRHPASGRRRPLGDPAKEYVRP